MVQAGLHHTKCTFVMYLSTEVARWMQACYAIKPLWVIVYYTPITSNCFHIEM